MNIPLIITIISSFAGVFLFLKYVIFVDIRLDNSIGKDILKHIKNKKHIILNEELNIKESVPNIFSCLTMIDKFPIYFSRDERLLTAGWRGVENITVIKTFRFFNKKLKKRIKEIILADGSININVVGSYGYSKLGEISSKNIMEPLLEKEHYADIESDIQQLMNGDIEKSGMLLHGLPGNGKTRLIKYLSLKYKMDVAIITFNADYTNEDILYLFSEIPNKSIVLMEDFDSVFDKRTCLIQNENIKFTFDGILNAFDGLWSSDKNLFYCITCNDIDKIDDSIKSRRGRVKFIREIKNPSLNIREKILGDKLIAEKTEGLSLDKIFYFKSQLDSGFEYDYIIKNINR